MTDKIKLLYIAGPTRSGSTILSNILGEINGFFNAGELIDIWDRGLTVDGMCGCGRSMSRCEIWNAVANQMFQNRSGPDVHEMIRLRDKLARSSKILRLMSSFWDKKSSDPALNTYLMNLENLYQALYRFTKARVIIDSSKNAGYAYLLTKISSIDLAVVHLVRDPRAVAFSWQRKKNGLWHENHVKNAMVWDIRNITSELLGSRIPGKYLLLKYESFMKDPQQAVNMILNKINEKAENLLFINKWEVKLNLNHTIYGNPDRFQSGIVKLKIDDEWKMKMKNLPKLTVAILTLPLLLRYKYLTN